MSRASAKRPLIAESTRSLQARWYALTSPDHKRTRAQRKAGVHPERMLPLIVAELRARGQLPE